MEFRELTQHSEALKEPAVGGSCYHLEAWSSRIRKVLESMKSPGETT
jgi:hypothetical protein